MIVTAPVPLNLILPTSEPVKPIAVVGRTLIASIQHIESDCF